jgi:flagellar biosynthesis/type III secretory pathway protein FliH
MNYETRLLEREQEAREAGLEAGRAAGRKAGIKVGIKLGKATGVKETLKKAIQGYRKFGATDEQIFQQLLTNYGEQFSPEQIKEMIKKA